uniref:ABCC1 n=1 Tax=Prorocentrum lima TaxID=39448 RepID=A0A4P8ETS1_9DINO|nr:ABCC1 [Prorocentrum lima]
MMEPESPQARAAPLLRGEVQRVPLDVDGNAAPGSAAAAAEAATSPMPFTGGLVSRLFFTWTFQLLKQAADTGKLEPSDLFALPAGSEPQPLYDSFTEAWRREAAAAVARGPPPGAGAGTHAASVLKTLWRVLIAKLLVVWVGRGAQTLLKFAFPYCLNSLVNYVNDEREPLWSGLRPALLLFIAQVALTLVTNHMDCWTTVIGLRTRSMLISAVFHKVVCLRLDTLAEFSSGRLNNIITTDVDAVRTLLPNLHQVLLTMPLTIAIALFSLYKTLGIAGLIGVFWMSVVILLLNPLLVRLSRKLSARQQAKTDERVRRVGETIAAIQIIKCYAWEEAAAEKVRQARQEELQYHWWLKVVYGSMGAIWQSTVPIATMFTFASYTWLNPDDRLTAATAFTAMSLLGLLQAPIFMIPGVTQQIVGASISGKRIGQLLQLPEANLPAVAGVSGLSEQVELEPPREMGPSSSGSGLSIDFEAASFTWSLGRSGAEAAATDPEAGGQAEATADFMLADLTLKVREGLLLCVVGATASGKSALIHAVLGEMPQTSGNLRGHAYVSRIQPMGFVPQQPWIFNGTVRQNVLFGEPYDEQRYLECVRSCALEQDFALLQAGDQTVVGEKGIALSGGQKARVSIARATYRAPSCGLLLIDDPYSALDAHVAREVHDTAVCKLLRRRTRVVVTNRLEFLKGCDQVLVLDAGRVEASGSYAEVCRSSRTLTDLLAAQGLQPGSDVEEDDSPQSPESAPGSADVGDSSKDVASEQESPMSAEQAETRASGNVERDVVLYYVRHLGGVFAVAALVAAYSLSELFSLSLPIWLSKWTSNPVRDEEAFYLGTYVLLSVCCVSMMAARDMVSMCVSLRAAAKLHANMLTAVLRAPMTFFQDTPQGRIINRFSKDINEIDVSLIFKVVYTLVPVLNTVGNFAVVLVSAYFSAICFAPAALIYWRVQKYYNSGCTDIKRIEKTSSSPVYNHFSSLCRENGISTVRAFHQVRQQCAISNGLVAEQQRPLYAETYVAAWLAMRLDLLGFTLTLLVSALVVFARGHLISTGSAALALKMANDTSSSMAGLVRQLSQFSMGFNCVERIKEYVTELPAEAPAVVAEHRPPPGWPSAGLLEVRNLWLQYRPGYPFVLQGLSFETAPGERIGIVGRTGAGKSSLLLALFRIVEPFSGSLVLDGQDMLTMGLQDLRASLAIIPQEAILFEGSLRANCDPFSLYSDAEVWSALESAQLSSWVNEQVAVQSREGGARLSHSPLDLMLREGGQNLSAGQRQLVAMARAILRRSKLVVLDEATASLDAATDSAIQQVVRRSFHGATTLTIAHRLQTIMDSDRVLVLQAGTIAELGPPDVLRQKEGGCFQSMVMEAERQ